jgi:DNA-binding response OmpR family regulator
MVLLVEDNDDLLELLGMLLDRAKIRHVGAHSLAEVQALGERLDEIDLAILDVNLGHNLPSGVDVARWLRARGRQVRIIFLTGHATDHPLVIEAAAEDGEILSKPIESKELVRIARGER